MAAAVVEQTRRHSPLPWLALVVGSVVAPVQAANWKVAPSLTVNETLTDNVTLAATNRQGDLITDLSPGISITGQGGRVRLNFNYALHQLQYAKDSARNQTQNALTATGAVEAIENWMFVDFNGSISQQSLSAFGGSSPSTTSANANKTETSSYRLSPYVRGLIGTLATYEVRYSGSTTRAESSAAAGVDSADWTARVAGASAFARLGWSLDASSQSIKYGNGRRSESDRLGGALTYRFTPQIRASLFAGRESSNLTSAVKQSYGNSGASLEWTPTERTQLSLSRGKRSFGNSHAFSVNHRTPRTAWRFVDSRDISALSNQFGVDLGTIYDLFFNLLSSEIPDPVARAARVNDLLAKEQISPDAHVVDSFLAARATLQRRREFSMVALGVRNTVTFVASQSTRQSLFAVASSFDDFTNNESVRQRGFGLNWSHRLTPLSSLTMLASRQNASGSGNTGAETTSRIFNINFLTQLGAGTSLSVGARQAVSDGTASYRENAVTAGLSARF